GPGRVRAGRRDAGGGPAAGAVGGLRAPDGRAGVSALVLAGAVALWQLVATLAPGLELSSPAGVWLAGWTMLADGSLQRAVWVSWQTVLEGFLMAVAVGVRFGLAVG